MTSMTESLRQAKAAYTLTPLAGMWTIAKRVNSAVVWQSDEMPLEAARSYRKFHTAWHAIELLTGVDRETHEADGKTMSLLGGADDMAKEFAQRYNLNGS